MRQPGPLRGSPGGGLPESDLEAIVLLVDGTEVSRRGSVGVLKGDLDQDGTFELLIRAVMTDGTEVDGEPIVVEVSRAWLGNPNVPEDMMLIAQELTTAISNHDWDAFRAVDLGAVGHD